MLAIGKLKMAAVAIFTVSIVLDVTAVDPATGVVKLHVGEITMPPGFTHKQLQGFDSIPGLIEKKGGLQIHYDIGGIAKPGGLRVGGQFSDRAKAMPIADRRWYKEQMAGGQPVHIAYSKKGVLLASFLKSGINFSVNAKTQKDLDEALKIILTYRGPDNTPK